jgi:ferrous iron transport protein B
VLVEKGTLTLGTFLAMGVVLAGFYFLIRKPKPGKESVQAITSLERG